MKRLITILALMAVAPGALAQMTDQAQIRQIIEMTKANWIGVRRWEGQDLIYFTHLESWKCGLSRIAFGVNTDAVTHEYPFDPCAEGEGAPSPIAQDRLPYIAFPLDTVASVTIELTFRDGAVLTETYQRDAVTIP